MNEPFYPSSLNLLVQVLQRNLQNHAKAQQEMKIFHCYHCGEHNWDQAELTDFITEIINSYNKAF